MSRYQIYKDIVDAAEAGDVAKLQELHRNGATLKDATLFGSEAFRVAFIKGNVAVLDEFRNNWGMDNNEALRIAAYYSDVDIMRFLRERWGLTANDVRVDGNIILTSAIADADLDVIRELRENWGFSAMDAFVAWMKLLPGNAGRKLISPGYEREAEYVREWIATVDVYPILFAASNSSMPYDQLQRLGISPKEYNQIVQHLIIIRSLRGPPKTVIVSLLLDVSYLTNLDEAQRSTFVRSLDQTIKVLLRCDNWSILKQFLLDSNMRTIQTLFDEVGVAGVPRDILTPDEIQMVLGRYNGEDVINYLLDHGVIGLEEPDPQYQHPDTSGYTATQLEDYLRSLPRPVPARECPYNEKCIICHDSFLLQRAEGGVVAVSIVQLPCRHVYHDACYRGLRETRLGYPRCLVCFESVPTDIIPTRLDIPGGSTVQAACESLRELNPRQLILHCSSLIEI